MTIPTRSLEFYQANTCPPGECVDGECGGSYGGYAGCGGCCSCRGGCRAHWEAQMEPRPMKPTDTKARLEQADPWGDDFGHLCSLQGAEMLLSLVPTYDHITLYAGHLEAIEREHGTVSAFLAGSPLDLTPLMPIHAGHPMFHFIDEEAKGEATFSQVDHTINSVVPMCTTCGALGAFGPSDEEADAAGLAMIRHVWERQECMDKVHLMGART